MQSLKSKVIIGLIRNRHLFKLKFKKEVVDESFDVEKFRSGIDKTSESMNRRIKGFDICDVNIDGIHGEWIDIDETPEDKIIMYIHGGGFISGSCHTHKAHVVKFVKEAGVKALLFDYRLAPEHPFPAATDDCLKVYRWLLEQGYKPENIVIAGESAGATLTLSTLLNIKCENLPQPAGAVSISPVTDLRCLADSFERNAPKDIAPYNSWNIWTGYYIGDADPSDPILSPQFGELDGLPPTYLCVGTYEIHQDDTVSFHERMKKFKSPSELHMYEGMVHAFPILAPMFPEATEALGDICRFIKEKLNL
ncbi:Acetyl esterase/lipase [Dethiosulfatibacter aminovorans DSM 17477]|uniref:Acetyl esterase/lipase n=1 Tax=Dethiosulfatibacter aminovorans DSM 17477 TaxID=1121476 RepID=A0A1M6MEV2_9FIRM|nr:alpha/beta hydrolase [Dethiosulfatibacter aminovorans]SHJ81984.1 Acetyl esterase/lipase [Dethiosulfatibacter aminovorans DSM 17477]